jgi:UDP-N-acetylglucosamine acyltransferase
MKAHPTAVVDPSAQIADDVEIGPFCIVGPGVRIGPGSRLVARVIVNGPAAIGARNVLHPNVVIGSAPQSIEPPAPGGRVEIGDDNVFREAVTVNLPATRGGATRIGSRNRFHACANVGHDCTVGDDIVLGSFAAISGAAVVGDRAWIEGSGGAEAGVTIGRGGWIQSHCCAVSDVPPFMGVGGDLSEVRGVNPLFRSPALERAFETVWGSGLPRAEALKRLETETSPEVAELVAFLLRPPREAAGE